MKRRTDRVKAQWERNLAKEGMPEELPYTVTFTPELAKHYQRARHTLQQETYADPPNSVVADALEPKLLKQEQRLVREYGRRVLMPPEELTAIPDDQDSLEDQVAEADYRQKATEVLNSLHNERTAGILRMRFGFDSEDDEIPTLEEVGRRYHISKERVRQIEILGYAELRDHGLFNAKLALDDKQV